MHAAFSLSELQAYALDVCKSELGVCFIFLKIVKFPVLVIPPSVEALWALVTAQKK